jgi:predicted ThiF/HesA family dinucleotide-utilizing enzyme|tara:strand:- start:205 stop:498 length:294 start_codon:yes stop_codon:yes gene_type:complete
MSLGEDRVLKHFNIVKIIKNLRDMKHVVIHHLNKAEDGKNKDKFMKQVAQNQKRVIQIVPEYQDEEDYYDDVNVQAPEGELEMQDQRGQGNLNLMEV